MTLHDRLLACFRAPDYVPLATPEIARTLGLARKERASLDLEIRQLIGPARSSRSKEDKLCLPRDADLRHGPDCVPQGGSAYVVGSGVRANPKKTRSRFPLENTGVAIHGDRRRGALSDELSSPRGGLHGGEPTGRVIRILERATRRSPATCSARNSFLRRPGRSAFHPRHLRPGSGQIRGASGCPPSATSRGQAGRVDAAARQS